MTERQAWFCPSCQKYHAPHVDTCAGTGEGTEAAPWKTFTPLVKPSTHTYPYPGTAGDVPNRLGCGVYQPRPIGAGTSIWNSVNGVATTGGVQ